MNAIDFLIAQHRALEEKMDALMDADKSSAKAALLAQVGDELTVHIASEEQVFYPAVKARRTQDILLESLEEHLSLKRLLADLLELEPVDQTFEPKFKVLKEQAEHHHEEEEENLFPQVRLLLSEVQLEALGLEMMELQDRLMRARKRPRDAVAAEIEHAAAL
jgi:hemerythrin superfamily protein